MLFKIVILATYIFEEGPWPALITEHLGVDFGPNTACLIHRVTRCRGYRDACVGLPKPTFWQRNLSSLKMGSSYTSAESADSAVRDISIHQGDQAAIQGGQGKPK